MKQIAVIAKWLWAIPWTACGLLVGCIGLLSGGTVSRSGTVVEFTGGAVRRLLRHMPIVNGASAMTLGHVVLAQTIDDLERTREHELVHVRQYECWGPLFIPAYLLCSLILWMRGRNPYWDNPFEQQAYRQS